QRQQGTESLSLRADRWFDLCRLVQGALHCLRWHRFGAHGLDGAAEVAVQFIKGRFMLGVSGHGYSPLPTSVSRVSSLPRALCKAVATAPGLMLRLSAISS